MTDTILPPNIENVGTQNYFNSIPSIEKEREVVNNTLLHRENKVVSKLSYNFWRLLGVCFLFFFILLSLISLYLIYDGKFQSTIQTTISPLFNASINTNNQYSFIPNTNNNYYNNFTINVRCNSS